MNALWRGGEGRLIAALLLVACPAISQTSSVCVEWQAKFSGIQATWHTTATSRSELLRIFGVPTREESKGVCTDLHYTVAGCSCSFAVCSQGTVVSKSITVGASAVPAFITSDPAAMADAIRSLQGSLREMQAEISRLQQAIDGLTPVPAPSLSQAMPAPPPSPAKKAAPSRTTANRQCAAVTAKGVQCSRRAAEGSVYCWQHRRN